MEPIACRPRRPKDKNRVEAAANDVERWVIAQMSLKGPILSPRIENLNEMLYERLNEINSRPFRGRGLLGSRRDRFVSEELAVMKPLPDLPFELGQWKRLIADKAHCIRLASYGGHRYSVPAAYVSKKVVVQITRRQVNIFDSQTMQPIGIHELQNNTTGNKTHILPDHLTSTEKYYRRTLEDWCRIMIEHGLPETLSQEFTAYLRNKKGNFPSGRLCSAVNRLFRNYPPNVIRKVIIRAMETQDVNYRHIRDLCKDFDCAEKNNRPREVSNEQSSYHENIRNNYK